MTAGDRHARSALRASALSHSRLGGLARARRARLISTGLVRGAAGDGSRAASTGPALSRAAHAQRVTSTACAQKTWSFGVFRRQAVVTSRVAVEVIQLERVEACGSALSDAGCDDLHQSRTSARASKCRVGTRRASVGRALWCPRVVQQQVFAGPGPVTAGLGLQAFPSVPVPRPKASAPRQEPPRARCCRPKSAGPESSRRRRLVCDLPLGAR